MCISDLLSEEVAYDYDDDHEIEVEEEHYDYLLHLFNDRCEQLLAEAEQYYDHLRRYEQLFEEEYDDDYLLHHFCDSLEQLFEEAEEYYDYLRHFCDHCEQLLEQQNCVVEQEAYSFYEDKEEEQPQFSVEPYLAQLTSFLSVDKSFLTPWNWNYSLNDDEESTESTMMNIQDGSFFSCEKSCVGWFPSAYTTTPYMV